jgi:uncharacterized protein YpmS
MKIWMWSAVGLLVINLFVVAIVAFLIHRDSTQLNQNQSQSQQKQVYSHLISFLYEDASKIAHPGKLCS